MTNLLSCRPAAFVGRISYSLYLWHWPLLVFASYGRAEPLSLGARLGLIASCLVLSAASWWMVERPFIARILLPRRRGLFFGTAAGTLAAVAAGGALDQAGHYGLVPKALPADVLRLANGQYDSLTGECRPEALASAQGLPCRFGVAGQPPTVLLWGNSYARMWTPALDIDARAHGVAGVSLLLSKCQPLLGVAFPDLPGCQAFNDAAIAYVAAHPALRTVILGANWFVAGPRLAELDKGLGALTGLGVRIVVLLPPPQPNFVVPRTLALAALRHAPPPPSIDETKARAAQKDSTDIIEALRQTYGFTTIDPADRMCDGTACRLEVDGYPMFFDAGHVSVTAARQAAGLFEPAFSP